jgi:tetratricopeptide (TPR) repeat protein
MLSLSFLALAVAVQAAPAPSDRSAGYGLFLEALSLRQAGRPDDAIKVLQRALKADPFAADAHAEIARIHMDEGRFDQAVAAVELAVRISPKRADLRSLAGQVHQFYGQSGGGESELRLAVREYEMAASLSPNEPGPLRDLTRLYSVLRDAKGALETWKRLSVVDPQNVDAFIQVASLSLAQGDTVAAISALETASTADPQNARVLQTLGDVKQQTGKPEEALRHYQAAARLDTKDLVTRLKIGEILLDTKRAEEALNLGDEMLKEDPSNRFALDLRARAFRELRRLDEALDIALSLSASEPKDLKASFLVVTLLQQKGSLAAAEERLLALIRRNTAGEDPEGVGRNNRVFWAHLGMVRQRLGRYLDAAEAFGEAARAGKEKEASLVTYRIDALVSAREFSRALQEAREARLDPAFKDERDLLYLEAYALRGTGDEAGAAALVEKRLGSNPEDAENTLAAGEFHQRGKNHARASELFTQVTKADPQNMRAFFGLGSSLERQKKFDDADAAFRKALLIQPDSAVTLNYLGYMNADRNVKVEEALGMIQRALDSDPENASYLDSLAWALYRLGRHAEAETAIRRAYKTQEKSAVVIGHLGLILEANGKTAEALKYLTLSLTAEDEDGELDRRLVEERVRALTQAAQRRP